MCTSVPCSPHSEAVGVLTSSIGGVACLRFGADMSAGVGCEMSIASWALGPDDRYIHAIAKKASACLSPKNIWPYLGSMPAYILFPDQEGKLLNSQK